MLARGHEERPDLGKEHERAHNGEPILLGLMPSLFALCSGRASMRPAVGDVNVGVWYPGAPATGGGDFSCRVCTTRTRAERGLIGLTLASHRRAVPGVLVRRDVCRAVCGLPAGALRKLSRIMFCEHLRLPYSSLQAFGSTQQVDLL